MSNILACRGKIKGLLKTPLVLVVVFTLLLLMAFQAPAQAKRPADSDGYVPLRYGCDLSHDWVGRTHKTWHNVNGRVVAEGWVELNWCRLTMQGAGPHDLYRILIHERAHAVEGWEHYEGTPEENAAWDPSPIRITGY